MKERKPDALNTCPLDAYMEGRKIRGPHDATNSETGNIIDSILLDQNRVSSPLLPLPKISPAGAAISYAHICIVCLQS